MTDQAVRLSARRGRPPEDRPLRVALVYVGQPESPSDPVMTPPLGTQLLGTLLLGAGHDVELFDTRLGGDEAVSDALLGWGPDVVGLSFLSAAADAAARLAGVARARQILTIAGGVHASIFRDELAAAGTYDVVVAGEGERALLDLCERVARGAPLPAVVDGPGLAELALPPLHRFDAYRNVYEKPGRDLRTYAVQLGRGCPMACTFCEVAQGASLQMDRATGMRYRPLADLVAEVDGARQAVGINYVIAVDSIATLNDSLLCGFASALHDMGGMSFQLNAHVNKFSDAAATTLGAFGDRASVWFGFESGSDRTLDFLQKGHTAARALAKAERALASGVRVGANLILGIPTETAEDLAATDAFARALLAAQRYPDQVLLNPNILNPLPGTVLHAWCVEHDLLADPTDHSIWSDRRIEELGRGPIVGVDYGEVVARYRALRDAAEVEAEPPQHRAWASQAD